MRRSICLAVLLAVSPITVAQDESSAPKPGPEHEPLKKFVGTWQIIAKDEEKNQNVMEGTMVYKMDLGGRWLVGEFKGKYAGKDIEGKSLSGYSSQKKKYVTFYASSWSKSPIMAEGIFDAKTNKLTYVSQATSEDDKATNQTKIVFSWMGEDRLLGDSFKLDSGVDYFRTDSEEKKAGTKIGSSTYTRKNK